MSHQLRSQLFSPDVLHAIPRSSGEHIRRLFSETGQRQPINRCLYVDLKSYLTDNCLVKVDRMSMAVSLEARVPFLDKDLVELAFRIPEHLKVEKGKTKLLLKSIAARRLPKECVYRPKEGFSIPIKNWLNDKLKPLVEDLLNTNQIRRDGLFQASTIDRLKKEHQRGEANHSHIIWSLMVFQAWRKHWLESY